MINIKDIQVLQLTEPINNSSTANPLTQRILNIIDSPGRKMQMPTLVKRCWSMSTNAELPQTARSITSPIHREQLYHLDQLLEKKVAMDPLFPKAKVFSWALAVIWMRSETNSLEQLGRLIHLLNFKDIDFNSIDLDKNLNTLFQEKIEYLYNQLNRESNKEIKWNRSRIEKEFAKALISNAGLINLGIIPALVALFIRLEEKESKYTLSFINSLRTIEELPSLRKRFASFTSPKSNRLGKDLIRVSLDLSKDHKIEGVDASRTALMAYLSYPRQENVSNCFAISVAIALFSNSKEKCLDDFREILTYGYLKKKIEGRSVHFRALLRQPLETVAQPLISNDPEILSKDPRIHHLLMLLGRPLPKDVSKLKTVDDLLSEFGSRKKSKGQFIWESDTKNPLITIWGNLLASMAEGRSDSLIKSALIGSCIHVAQEKGKPEHEINKLKEAILKRAYLYYDPTIAGNSPRDNGAFVLYDKLGSKTTERIDTPEKFQSFLSHCLDNSDLGVWYRKTKTLYRIMEVYHPEGRKAVKSMESLKKLSFTPWVTKMGNNPKEILRTYKGDMHLEVTSKFKPGSQEDLFKKVLSIGESFYAQKKAHKRASSVLIPVRLVGLHTFNLILSHPTFLKCLIEKDKNPLDNLLVHATKISEMAVPENTINEICEYLLKKFPEKGSCLAAFGGKFLKIMEFRNLLIEHFPSSMVDKKLFQFLPEAYKEDLGQSSIHFADTNWAGDGKDIHLAFCYNPLNLKLELFEIEETGKLLKPLDTHALGQEEIWEFFSEKIFTENS